MAATAPWSWGYWPYCNPYHAAPVVVNNTTIDYSQPLVLAAPASDATSDLAADAAPTPTHRVMDLLDAARAAFVQRDYDGALAKCDQAVARQPDSSAAHELRGLALFALQRYKEAAAPVYAVLSVGPGWDWTTLIGFYPQTEDYTEQLRALEEYVTSNPDVAEARFLVGYHYMTGGHNVAAAGQFKEAARLNAQDQLSAQLAALMTPKAAAQPPAPSTTVTAAKPIDASALSGVWTSTRTDGTCITLSLAEDGKYTWKFAQKDHPQTFSGAYDVADNLLILKDGNSPVMIGQVTLLSDSSFQFKLAGNNPSDPGLTFDK